MPKEFEVKVKKYECENCGAFYENLSHFYKCYISDKEICDKCAKKVQLFRHDWGTYGTYYVHKDFYNPNYIKSNDTYIKMYNELEEEFYDKLKELNSKYLKGELK